MPVHLFRHIARIIGIALLLGITAASSSAQRFEHQRQALIALYEATDGENWTNNSGWLSDNVDNWYGVEASGGNIRELDLSGNNLTGSIPAAVGALVSLRILDLSNNDLSGPLPYNIGNLRILERISLANNPNLSGTLPYMMTGLFRLTTFWFDHTGLCELSISGFQDWLNTLTNLRRSGCTTPFDEGLVGTCERSMGEQYLDANNVRARILNTGGLFYRGEPHVYEVPKGSGIHSIFAGALWIGGLIDNDLRTSAARYGNNELWAGPLDENGYPPEDCRDYDRIYKVDRKDLRAFEESGIAAHDLRDWPTGLGAPTLDANGELIDVMHLPLSARKNRRIDLAAGERPAIRGDQSVWWVMNDRGNSHDGTASLPMGIEVHGHAFALRNRSSLATHATLYNYRLFNRNPVPITQAYIGVFVDTDLGDFDDDLIGADTTLGMGFTYNWDNVDGGRGGYGPDPPALGVLFLEGPVAEIDRKDNDKDGIIDEPGERLRTTTVGSYYGGGGVTQDPTTGAHYYSYMQALWKDGLPYTLGGNGRDFSTTPTKYFFPGDPVTRQYWSEMNSDNQGTYIEPGDRRWFISSGPFTIEPNGDADFTFAIIWARGDDHLDSITDLRSAARGFHEVFATENWDQPVIIPEPSKPGSPNLAAALDHNYPDPFSETTTIRYRLPHAAHVKVTVFNLLGKEVQTLIDDVKVEGTYAVEFSGVDLPSGVYAYRVEFGHAVETRLMTLVK